MRWNKGRRGSLAALVAVAAAGVLLLTAPSAEEKRVSIYTAQTSFSLPVQDRANGEYVALASALQPMGGVSAAADGDVWRVRFNRVEGEFREGQARCRVDRKLVEMPAPFVVENGRALVPLPSLAVLLARFLESRVDFHVTSRRLLVGGASTRFTLEMKKDQQLILSFSAPVNPTVATEPGRLRLTFVREPVVSGTGTFSFVDDKLVSAVRFTEGNGAAEITVAGERALMAEFREGGKTIVVSAAPGPVAQAPAVPEPPAPSPSAPEAALPAAPAATPSAEVTALSAGAQRHGFVVMLDPSHGGEERGAALSDTLAEKDVTLAFARRLRHELQQRGAVVILLRDSDSALPLEQRAMYANATRPAVFVSLHATTLGRGLRVYTSLVPPAELKPQAFLPWETAQSPYVEASRLVANAVVEESGETGVPLTMLPAPLRPLNSVATAAIAIELAPPAGRVEALASPQYLQRVADAVAAGIAAARPKLAEAR